MSKQPNYVFDDVDSDELYHHGILGQRWGRRRFQNEDGSWTPEGRERYGEGGARAKSDVQKYKAKVAFKTQQYKADLKSKAQKEKDKRAAKEERVRLKEQAKTDRALKKEQAKTEKQDRPLGMKLTKTGKMSDQDLEQAVNRLKLQAEYNKNYILATQPSPALVKADRFFSGPTGQMVQAVAVATVPKIAEQVAREASKSAFKYANKEDRDKAALELEEKKQTIASTKAKTESELKDSELKRATDKAKSDSELKDAETKRRIDISNQKASLWEKENEVKRLNRQSDNADKLARSKQEAAQKLEEEKMKGYDIEFKDQFGKTQTRHVEGSNERENAKLMGFNVGMDRVKGSIERDNEQQKFDNQYKASIKQRELAEAEKDAEQRRAIQRDVHQAITNAYASGDIDIAKASQIAGENAASTQIEYRKMANDKVAIDKGNGIVQVVKEEELWPILQAAGRLR
ncbi:MAG: hypothetical protein IJ880_13705 [Bacilli bacterium]|nr:hypothetical protein [Bacilli bacterium]